MLLEKISVSFCKAGMTLQVAIWHYHGYISASVCKMLMFVNNSWKTVQCTEHEHTIIWLESFFLFISVCVSQFRFINFKLFFCLKCARVLKEANISVVFLMSWNCAWHFFCYNCNPSLNLYENCATFFVWNTDAAREIKPSHSLKCWQEEEIFETSFFCQG
jgi:hypothetical protein